MINDGTKIAFIISKALQITIILVKDAKVTVRTKQNTPVTAVTRFTLFLTHVPIKLGSPPKGSANGT